MVITYPVPMKRFELFSTNLCRSSMLQSNIRPSDQTAKCYLFLQLAWIETRSETCRYNRAHVPTRQHDQGLISTSWTHLDLKRAVFTVTRNTEVWILLISITVKLHSVWSVGDVIVFTRLLLGLYYLTHWLFIILKRSSDALVI